MSSLSTLVLLVDGLLAHAQDGGDLGPTPSLSPGAVDVQILQALGKSVQGGDCGQSYGRVCCGEVRFVHAVNVP